MKVLALVDRDTRTARTMVVDNVTAATLMPIVRANVAKEATHQHLRPHNFTHIHVASSRVERV